MKKIIALLSAASLLTLSSCDLAMLGEGMGRRDTQRIERGMSQEQVYSLMGRPTYRRFGDNGIEEWEYHKSGLFEKADHCHQLFLWARRTYEYVQWRLQ